MLTFTLSAFGQTNNDLTSTSGQRTSGLNPVPPTRAGQQAGAGASAESGFVARPVSVQLLVGSQGVGADVRYGFLPKWSARLGFGLIPVTLNNIFGFSSFNTYNQLSARFSNVHLMADYAPFKSSFFRIVGGGAYLVKGDASFMVTPQGSYQFGSSTVTADQLGNISASVDWRGFAPYLGVSLFKAFPNKLFNTNLDIGAYYLSRPQTSLIGTKMLSDNSAQQPQFNQNMSGYRWMPVLQLNFNFRIK